MRFALAAWSYFTFSTYGVLPDGPCLWQKCLRTSLPQGESLITKGIQRVGKRAFVHLVVAPPRLAR